MFKNYKDLQKWITSADAEVTNFFWSDFQNNSGKLLTFTVNDLPFSVEADRDSIIEWLNDTQPYIKTDSGSPKDEYTVDWCEALQCEIDNALQDKHFDFILQFFGSITAIV